jgi:hypothetical protein
MAFHLTYAPSPDRPPHDGRGPLKRIALIAQVLVALFVGSVIGDIALSGGRWSSVLIADAGDALDVGANLVVGAIGR